MECLHSCIQAQTFKKLFFVMPLISSTYILLTFGAVWKQCHIPYLVTFVPRDGKWGARWIIPSLITIFSRTFCSGHLSGLINGIVASSSNWVWRIFFISLWKVTSPSINVIVMISPCDLSFIGRSLYVICIFTSSNSISWSLKAVLHPKYYVQSTILLGEMMP